LHDNVNRFSDSWTSFQTHSKVGKPGQEVQLSDNLLALSCMVVVEVFCL